MARSARVPASIDLCASHRSTETLQQQGRTDESSSVRPTPLRRELLMLTEISWPSGLTIEVVDGFVLHERPSLRRVAFGVRGDSADGVYTMNVGWPRRTRNLRFEIGLLTLASEVPLEEHLGLVLHGRNTEYRDRLLAPQIPVGV